MRSRLMHPIADAGQPEGEADADVSWHVERGLVLEPNADRERDRAGDEHVEGNDEVGQYRTNGGNEVGHRPPFSLRVTVS